MAPRRDRGTAMAKNTARAGAANLAQRHTFGYRVKTFFTRYWMLHLMVLPGLIYFLVFKYGPMYGLIIAFKNYKGAVGGVKAIFGSDWVGLRHFKTFLTSTQFPRLMRNTIVLSLLRLAICFPAPIILAILLNEVRIRWYKKTVQTITYMPYFLSWVVVSGLLKILVGTEGPLNALLGHFGIEPIYFMASTKYFRTLLIISEIWKTVGYGTIVYLAAISSVDVELYEAAQLDGAGKLKQILHVTLPAISEIIAIMLILQVGRIMGDNFEQIYTMYSEAVYEVADVFDTYIYRTGIIGSNFSYTTAVSLFKSLISLALILLTNKATKKLGSSGLF